MSDIENFQNGDIVKNILWPQFGLGRVLGIDPEVPGGFVVEFEKATYADHDGGGLGEPGHCWYCFPGTIELVLRPSELVPGETKFQVKGRSGWLHFFDPGTIGTFKRMHGLGVVLVDANGLEQSVHPEDLEIIQVTPAPAKKPRTFDLNSQCGRILAHLLAGNTLTPLQAFGVFGTFRLAARIKELRDAGHKIKTTIKRDPNGRPYAEYSLRNSGRF